jgi:Mg-chelatase subunit ChlD
MNPDLPPNPRADLEAKVTALLLGELSAAEADTMRELIAKDPELSRLRDRLSLTLDLLRETTATPAGETPPQPASLKLSPARREKLLAHFKTIAPKEFAPPPRWKMSRLLVPLAAAVVLLAALIIPNFVRPRTTGMTLRTLGVEGTPAALNQPAPTQTARAQAVNATLGVPPPSAAPPAAHLALSKPPERLLSENDREAKHPANQIVLPVDTNQMVASVDNKEQLAEAETLNYSGQIATGGTVSVLSASSKTKEFSQVQNAGDLQSHYSFKKDESRTRPPAPATAGENFALTDGIVQLPPAAPGSVGGGGGGGAGAASAVLLQKEQFQSAAAPLTTRAFGGMGGGGGGTLTPDAVKSVERYLRASGMKEEQIAAELAEISGLTNTGSRTENVTNFGSFVLGDTPATGSLFQSAQKDKLAKVESIQRLTPLPAPAAAPPPSSAGTPSDAIRGLAAASPPPASAAYPGDRLDAPLPRPALPAPVPQAEVLTRTNAFTTFSLNVSDVAFRLAAASLQNGLMPEPASMRSEEFINAFDYRDPEPAPGAPIGFAWERASDPFAHNRDLLRFSIKTAAQGRQAGRPLNLVLLLDKSGSMERADRVEIISRALDVLAAQLQPQDTLSVVVFARTARLFVDGVPGGQAGHIAKDLRALTPEGGTNLEEAMKLAYAAALRHYLANGENRVVLMTDGAANLGNVDPRALKQNVETNRKQGIALDCFGVGWDGYNDDLLETLSRAGNGRYGFINTPEEAATEFAAKLAGALRVAAADVKVQVEFNPNRVTSYRQIGYAKDQLKKEDFRDNNVRAAQIGVAESGNALFAVEINPAGEGPLGTVHVRFRVPGTSDYQEHEWTVPYTGSAVPLEKTGPAMRLAASAAAFCEWLASSPYAAEVTPDRLLSCLNGVPQVYGADDRPARLVWMIRQAKSISGK